MEKMSTNTREVRRDRLWPYRNRAVKDDEVQVGRMLYIDFVREGASLKDAFRCVFEESDLDPDDLCPKRLNHIIVLLRKEEAVVRRKASQKPPTTTGYQQFYERRVPLLSFSKNRLAGLQPLVTVSGPTEPISGPTECSSPGVLPDTPSTSVHVDGLSLLNTHFPHSPLHPPSAGASPPFGSSLSQGVDQIVVQARMRFLRGCSDGSEYMAKIEQLTRDKDSLQKQIAVLKKRLLEARSPKRVVKHGPSAFVGPKDHEEVLCRLRASLREKSAQIGELENTILELSERLQNNQVIETMEGKSFSPAVDQCIVKLVGLGVADAMVGPVMQAVVEMCGKQLSHVPSARSVGRRIAGVDMVGYG